MAKSRRRNWSRRSTMQLIADYNGNGGGYSYIVVTFAEGTTATVGQILFHDYTGDGWGS